jgi:hypothetical protein
MEKFFTPKIRRTVHPRPLHDWRVYKLLEKAVLDCWGRSE